MPGSEKVHQNLEEEKGGCQPTFDSYTETSLKFYPDRCINCRRCTQVCPHAVFEEGTDTAFLARPSACMECGACALNCPVQAIEVQSGVGCAWAMIGAAIRGRSMDACSCGGDKGSCCGDRQEKNPPCCCPPPLTQKASAAEYLNAPGNPA